jgi:CRP-like cAMP-binding protein
MEQNRLESAPLSDNLELIGEGPSFRNRLCLMLAQAKCFEQFEQKEIEVLADHMKAYRAKKGVTIFHEGERNSYLCILVTGKVGVFKEDEHREVKLLTSIMPGKIFGEISLIDDFPYSASIVAETEATLLLMSRGSFRQCVDINPVLGVRLLRLITTMLCQRLRSTSGQLIDLIHT